MRDDLSRLRESLKTNTSRRGERVRREKAFELGKELEPKLQEITTKIKEKIDQHFSLYEGIQEQNRIADLVSGFRRYIKNLGQAGKIIAHVRMQSAVDAFNEISGREQKIYDSLSETIQPILDSYIGSRERTAKSSIEREEVDRHFRMVGEQMHEVGRHLVQKRLYAAADVSGIEQLQHELEQEISRPQ